MLTGHAVHSFHLPALNVTFILMKHQNTRLIIASSYEDVNPDNSQWLLM